MRMIWGISKWRDWQRCEAMFVAKYVTKEWRDFPSPQMERGRELHKAFEDGIKYDIPLTDHADKAVHQFEPLRAWLYGQKAEGTSVLAEHKLGITRNYQPTDFFGKDLWVRLALDVVVDAPYSVLVIDWKSGRYKPEHREDASFYRACVRHAMQKPTTIQYHYIDEPASSFALPEASTDTGALAGWMKRTNTADAALAAGKADLMPGPQCKWCGAFKCPMNRNEKLR